MLLAMVASGIIMGAYSLSSAVEDQFAEIASCFDGSANANGGQGDGTGGDGGSGRGAGNGGGFTIC